MQHSDDDDDDSPDILPQIGYDCENVCVCRCVFVRVSVRVRLRACRSVSMLYDLALGAPTRPSFR